MSFVYFILLYIRFLRNFSLHIARVNQKHKKPSTEKVCYLNQLVLRCYTLKKTTYTQSKTADFNWVRVRVN